MKKQTNKQKTPSHICVQSWWRHQMDIFSMSVFLCERDPTVTGGFPHQGQWRATSMFSLICAWTNGWANNQDAGGVRRHGAHYDVTVMVCIVDEVQYPNSSEWVNEWLSLMVFLVQRGACNSYKPCNHDLYMTTTLRLTALYHFYKEGIANSASQHSQSLCPGEYNEAGHPFPQRLR